MFKSCFSKWKQQFLVNKPLIWRFFSVAEKPSFIKSDFWDFFFQFLRDQESNQILSVDASNKQMWMRDFPYHMSIEFVANGARASLECLSTVESNHRFRGRLIMESTMWATRWGTFIYRCHVSDVFSRYIWIFLASKMVLINSSLCQWVKNSPFPLYSNSVTQDIIKVVKHPWSKSCP